MRQFLSFIITVALLGFISFSMYCLGHIVAETQKDLECDRKIKDLKAAQEKANKEIQEAEQYKREKQASHFIGVINEHIEKNKQHEETMRAMRADNNGLRVSATICNNRHREMREANAAASKDVSEVGTEGTLRLPPTLEEELYAITDDAGAVVIMYEDCRATIEERIGFE